MRRDIAARMLVEALEALLTPCPAFARGFSYGAEMAALGARRRRCRRAWASHVANARQFLIDAAQQAPSGGGAIIVGSGRLIEVPLPALAARFSQVVLADVIHPLPVRLAAARFRNVHLLPVDVTGALAPLHQALLDGSPLPTPSPPDLGGFDFAASCNVLSQLPLLPLEAIDARRSTIPDTEKQAFAQALAADHLAWMRRLARVAALFTDVESVRRDRSGREEREPTTWGVPLPSPDHVWTWAIAPAPEDERDRDLLHTVHAWRNLNAS